MYDTSTWYYNSIPGSHKNLPVLDKGYDMADEDEDFAVS